MILCGWYQLLLLVIQLKNYGFAGSFQYIEGTLVGNLNFGGCPPQTNQPLPLWAWNSEEWPAFGGCCTALKYMGYPLALSSDSARLELVQGETWQSWSHRVVAVTSFFLLKIFVVKVLTDIFEMFYFQRWRGLARRDAPADWGLWNWWFFLRKP